MTPDRTLLVVGARPGSLGEAIAHEAENSGRWSVTTAGISNEDVPLDVLDVRGMDLLFARHRFQSVVCTVGVNRETTITNLSDYLEEAMDVNVCGPMNLLQEWARPAIEQGDTQERHFVAISSNSATIARSRSLAYCASKAALSMALRCAAREAAWTGLSIYGYEPGWIEGTPMSQEVEDRMVSASTARHRIPGSRVLDPNRLAEMIVRNLDHHGDLNGCLIRIDGGEQ